MRDDGLDAVREATVAEENRRNRAIGRDRGIERLVSVGSYRDRRWAVVVDAEHDDFQDDATMHLAQRVALTLPPRRGGGNGRANSGLRYLLSSLLPPAAGSKVAP